MIFFQWLVILVCSMIASLVLPLLVASRVADAAPDDPGNRGMRRVLLWAGSLADTTAAVFAGALLGVWWLPAMTAGLLFFLGKLGLSEVAVARTGKKGAATTRTGEEEHARLEHRRRLVKAVPPGVARQGLAAWMGLALLHLMVLLLFLMPFRLWPGW